MAILEIAKSNQNISTGTHIIHSSEDIPALVILQKGVVEICLLGGEEKKNVLFEVSAPAVLKPCQLVTGDSSITDIYTKSDCLISCFSANAKSLPKIMASKPSIALLALKSAVNEVFECYVKDSSAESIQKLFSTQFATVALGYAVVCPEMFNHEESKTSDPVLNEAEKVYQAFLKSGKSLPEKIDSDFLRKDFSEFNFDENVYYPFAKNDFLYYRKISNLPQNVQGFITQKDPVFLFETISRLGSLLSKLYLNLSNRCKQHSHLVSMFHEGSYGWLKKISDRIDAASSEAEIKTGLSEYTKFFINSVKVQEESFKKLWGNGYSNVDLDRLNKLNNSLNALISNLDKKDTSNASSTSVMSEGEESWKDMMKKVSSWASFPDEKFAELDASLTEIKKHSNLLDPRTEMRKVRRKINQLYIELYEKVALKYLPNRKNLPNYVKMFLKFGIVDEALLKEEDLRFLANHLESEVSKYPIYDTIEWLEKIYDKEIPTSVNDLGLTLFEILRHENRDKKWKRESDLPPELNSSIARVKFEIKSMLAPMIKLTSGIIINNFAPFNSQSIISSINHAYTSKKRLEEAISKLLSIDFSAFHREILYSNQKFRINREFIQLQVIPNFILVPSAGPHYQFWQEREGNARMSRGRLAGPLFANEDLFDMLLNVAGVYRWELTKTTMGIDWNNISQTSITADYTDYVQFFRKNRDLSIEMKEKLAKEFKRFRDDRSKFVHDYQLYVKYESEGTQRLNAVLRKIFCKHIPFSKEIRKKLLKLPSYTEPITKGVNIRARKARELEPRYRKIRSENKDIIPLELENTLRFYAGEM